MLIKPKQPPENSHPQAIKNVKKYALGEREEARGEKTLRWRRKFPRSIRDSPLPFSPFLPAPRITRDSPFPFLR